MVMVEFFLLLLALSKLAMGEILVKTCMPTDFKGVISQDDIFSLTIAAEFDTKATTYLVGGYAQQTSTR